MKICIIGAGAIGGLLAARLLRQGEDVTIIARGAHLRAIRERGLTLLDGGDEVAVKVAAYESLEEIEPQQLVILGVKAHQIQQIATSIPSILDENGFIMTAQNGIPWWYFFKSGGMYEGHIVESVDPGGLIARTLPIERVVGSVVYPAAEVIAPGVIKLVEGNRFSVAEIDGAKTDRIRRVSEVLTGAGFKAPVVSDLRGEIWTKLWGNLSLNPISALTGATLAGILRHDHGRTLAAEMMREAQSVGEALGVRFRISLEKRLAGAEEVGDHKTSMLQDIEARRRTELDALVGSIVELGALTGVHTPTIYAVYSCLRLLEDTKTH